jgi:hypothetical protein
LIRNKYDFEGIATIVADDDIGYETTTYIKIMQDIDLSTIKSWIPINNSRDKEQIARLHIDGNYKTVKGFAPIDFAEGAGIQQSGLDRNQPSMFGIIYGTVINLNVEDASIRTETSSVGILAGWVGFEDLPATITNVKVAGTLIGKHAVGGIAGHATNATFNNCIAEVTINAERHAGGLVGRYNENVSFVNCSTKGSVSGTRGVGGLIGFNNMVSEQAIMVDGCVAECAVSGNYQVGGLVGHTVSPMHITGCYVKQNVTAAARKRSGDFMPGKQVGGILGVGAEANVTLTECRFDGNISADGDFAGGIMGLNTGSATISNCHAKCSTIVNTGQYHNDFPNVNYDMIGVGGILGGSRGTDLKVYECFVDEGTISSKALGNMTSHPADWSSWATSVRNGTKGYKGGAVGGIVGYVAETTNVVINHNISWITSIKCDRNNIYDAPCAPIVGCVSSEHGEKFQDNRYYQSSQGAQMTITDTYDSYVMREGLLGVITESVLNVIEEKGTVPKGTVPNYYCLFCRPVSNSEHATGRNSPSQTAKTYFSSKKWNTTSFKPFLAIPVTPEFDSMYGTQVLTPEDYTEL